MEFKDILHGHIFCGLGGGAKGYNNGHARVGNMVARFRCLGGIDVDPAAVRDFGRLAGVPGTLLDLFDREQYTAFHGKEPPADWRQAVPADIQRAFAWERPHIIFLSAPCKGFSGLLPQKASESAKYQALNGLTLRGIWLMLEAYKDDPVELIVFENVPRIANRGRALLDRIVGLLQHYGYVVAETTHDCGEIGNLAQSRKRFLLVARHAAKVPPFLYEPDKHPLRGVGEVLEKLPVPGPEPVLPMHRMPSLHFKTWVRLAFVEAGSDWRSLNRLNVEDGFLRDYGLVPETDWRSSVLGVRTWNEPSGTVTSRGGPTNGAFSVADPRIDGHVKSVQHGVRRWDQPSGVVTSKMMVGGGPHAVADPRIEGTRFNHTYRIVEWSKPAPAVAGGGGPAGGLAVADPRGGNFKNQRGVVDWEEPAGTVAGESLPSNGKFAVADPRYPWSEKSTHESKMSVIDWTVSSKTVTGSDRVGSGALSVADPRGAPGRHVNGKYRVTAFDEPASTVIAGSTTGNGAFAVADPRPKALGRSDRDVYMTQGHYGVLPWWATAGSIPAYAKNNNGRWSVADPRPGDGDEAAALPKPNDRLVAVIRALDGTWHRPFTTLELAALQGLVDPEETLELDGLSDSAWRERIGNAVPPPAAQAIASAMGRTLLLAWSGESFMLSSEPIWVRPIVTALSVDLPHHR